MYELLGLSILLGLPCIIVAIGAILVDRFDKGGR